MPVSEPTEYARLVGRAGPRYVGTYSQKIDSQRRTVLPIELFGLFSRKEIHRPRVNGLPEHPFHYKSVLFYFVPTIHEVISVLDVDADNIFGIARTLYKQKKILRGMDVYQHLYAARITRENRITIPRIIYDGMSWNSQERLYFIGHGKYFSIESHDYDINEPKKRLRWQN